MAVNDRPLASAPAGDPRTRLEQPEVAAARNVLLDHADGLAFLVLALYGFLGRGEAITDALADGITELRGAARPGGPTGALSLLRTLKDEKVSRGPGHLVEVARALGRQLEPST